MTERLYPEGRGGRAELVIARVGRVLHESARDQRLQDAMHNSLAEAELARDHADADGAVASGECEEDVCDSIRRLGPNCDWLHQFSFDSGLGYADLMESSASQNDCGLESRF